MDFSHLLAFPLCMHALKVEMVSREGEKIRVDEHMKERGGAFSQAVVIVHLEAFAASAWGGV